MMKKYAQLALMMTSMMSSQLLWGAQATAAEFKDVGYTSWLRSDDKQKLLVPDTSTEMLKMSKLPDRSAQEILNNFERTQIIPALEHRQYLTHGFSHAVSTFFMELLMPTPYATEKCSITAANVLQISANMKAINIIIDDPRSKIREFCAQNPSVLLKLDNLDDVQLLETLEDLGLLEDTSQDAGISKLLHNTNFVSRLKNAENLQFLKHKILVDRLNNPEIVKKWQDPNRFAVGINLIGLLSTIDKINHNMERIIGILEQVDNIKKDHFRIWRPIVSALPYYMTIDHERDLKCIIDIIAQHELSLLDGDRHLFCARLFYSIYSNSNYTKMSAETAITTIIKAVVQLPVTPFNNKHFSDICTHFINLMPEKRGYAVQRIVEVVANLPVTLFNDQYFIAICTHFINLMPEKGEHVVRYILTVVANLPVTPFNNKHFSDICTHFINLIPEPKKDEYAVARIVEAVARISTNLFNNKYFIAICTHFINLMPYKGGAKIPGVVVAVAKIPVELFNNKRFIDICDHFINRVDKLYRFGLSNICDIIQELSQLSTNLFDDGDKENLLRNQKIINDHMRAYEARYPDRYKTVNK